MNDSGDSGAKFASLRGRSWSKMVGMALSPMIPGSTGVAARLALIAASHH
jgi:hypothetical protein